jgi:peptidoglycan/xylan/chitin deacetylase (PgdA/CDA1 family)
MESLCLEVHAEVEKPEATLMKLNGMSTLRRTARRLRDIIAPGPLILLYHRVAEVDMDPWCLCVSPKHFAEHLEVIRKYGHPIRLQELNQALREGKLLAQSIVITFDDGYADNLNKARPLLERYDAPATVFVAGGYVGQEREFWWDQIEGLLLQPGTLPERLSLSLNGFSSRWELGGAVHYEEENRRRDRDWTVPGNIPSDRFSFYLSVCEDLRLLTEDERQKALSQLRDWSGTQPKTRPTFRPLSSGELLILEQGDLIEVGAHTMTHPFLPAQPLAVQRQEIWESRAHLEEIIGRPVTSFAYPYGEYSKETVALVRETGFACACTTSASSVWHYADPFQLPRVAIKDWDGEEFERRLLSMRLV